MTIEGKTVFVLHTSFALVDVLNKRFVEQLPGVRMVNIVDDSLLVDVREAGHLIPSVTRRMVGYAILAESAGADAIFNTCSSVGEAADVMRQVVDIPVVKIDDAMAGEAITYGGRVAVTATLPTTLAPTARLIERKAREKGKAIEIHRHLVKGAFDMLMAGDPAKHDEMILDEIERAAQEADVIVLAQGSMARLIPKLEGKISIPVLSSPDRGIAALRDILAQS